MTLFLKIADFAVGNRLGKSSESVIHYVKFWGLTGDGSANKSVVPCTTLEQNRGSENWIITSIFELKKINLFHCPPLPITKT